MSAVFTDIGTIVADIARSYVGVPSAHHSRFHTGSYVRRGQSAYELHTPHSVETGLCCSALANLVVKDVLMRVGVDGNVPRHVKGFYWWEMMEFLDIGQPGIIKPGAFLFTHTSRNRTPPSHIGIYLGNGKVIHSPGIDGSKVEAISLGSFASYIDLPPFYGSVMAARRLLLQ